jgi:hypothetical protein
MWFVRSNICVIFRVLNAEYTCGPCQRQYVVTLWQAHTICHKYRKRVGARLVLSVSDGGSLPGQGLMLDTSRASRQAVRRVCAQAGSWADVELTALPQGLGTVAASVLSSRRRLADWSTSGDEVCACSTVALVNVLGYPKPRWIFSEKYNTKLYR